MLHGRLPALPQQADGSIAKYAHRQLLMQTTNVWAVKNMMHDQVLAQTAAEHAA